MFPSGEVIQACGECALKAKFYASIDIKRTTSPEFNSLLNIKLDLFSMLDLHEIREFSRLF